MYQKACSAASGGCVEHEHHRDGLIPDTSDREHTFRFSSFPEHTSVPSPDGPCHLVDRERGYYLVYSSFVISAPAPPADHDYSGFDIVKATQYGAITRVRELVEAGWDVNQPDSETVSLLHWAAINNRREIVR